MSAVAWSADDEAQLLELRKTHTLREVAELMGRGFYAVKNRYHVLMKKAATQGLQERPYQPEADLHRIWQEIQKLDTSVDAANFGTYRINQGVAA